jgi:hypothetical protein
MKYPIPLTTLLRSTPRSKKKMKKKIPLPKSRSPVSRSAPNHCTSAWTEKKKYEKKTEASQPNPSADCLFPVIERPVLQPQRSGDRVSTTTGEPSNPLSHDLSTLSTEIRPEPHPLPGSLLFAGRSPLSPL